MRSFIPTLIAFDVVVVKFCADNALAIERRKAKIEDFIKAAITHITKLEFFYIFKVAYDKIMISENIQAGFRGAGLVLFDPETVISKLDVKL